MDVIKLGFIEPKCNGADYKNLESMIEKSYHVIICYLNL